MVDVALCGRAEMQEMKFTQEEKETIKKMTTWQLINLFSIGANLRAIDSDMQGLREFSKDLKDING